MTECTFTGTVISVGNDEAGQPRVLIHSTVEQLRGKPYPIRREAEITIRWPIDAVKPEPSSAPCGPV